jgi:hypothetical protein
MAGFKTHLTASSVVGIGYGVAAYTMYNVPLPSCILATGLCSVSGMLPDIDSDSGRPVRESLAFGAAVVAMMFADRLKQLGAPSETIVLAGAMTYLLIRFGLGAFLKRYTVHRGMFHSLPAAVIMGELAFLLASGSQELRIYKAGAVALGYVIHLLLDELYSIQWSRGRLRLKSSFGTAMKLIGHSWWANGSAYLKLALLTFLILEEPSWTQQFYEQRVERPAEQTAARIMDQLVR